MVNLISNQGLQLICCPSSHQATSPGFASASWWAKQWCRQRSSNSQRPRSDPTSGLYHPILGGAIPPGKYIVNLGHRPISIVEHVTYLKYVETTNLPIIWYCAMVKLNVIMLGLYGVVFPRHKRFFMVSKLWASPNFWEGRFDVGWYTSCMVKLRGMNGLWSHPPPWHWKSLGHYGPFTLPMEAWPIFTMVHGVMKLERNIWSGWWFPKNHGYSCCMVTRQNALNLKPQVKIGWRIKHGTPDPALRKKKTSQGFKHRSPYWHCRELGCTHFVIKPHGTPRQTAVSRTKNMKGWPPWWYVPNNYIMVLMVL